MATDSPTLWGAVLEGHQFDLADWCEVLAAPYDPWVDVVDHAGAEIHVLRSAVLDDAADESDARLRALPLIEKLNGAALLSRNTESVNFGGIARIDNGRAVTIAKFASGDAAGRSRMKGYAVVLNSEGEIIPQVRTRSDPQRWIATAEGNDIVADLLVNLARANNWYDLYKAIELVQRLAGGQHALENRLGSKEADWEGARLTANYFRHARAYRPAQLTDFAVAKRLVILVANEILRGIAP